MVTPSRPRIGHGVAVALPNLLTLARLVSIPFIVWSLLGGACVFIPYALACVSDLLDGALARRLGGETRVGSVLDTSTDFLLIFGVSATLYVKGLLSVSFLALVLVAFAQFVARPRVSCDPLGRHIGTVLFIAIGVTVLEPSLFVALWASTVASAYIVAALILRWLPRRSSNQPSSIF